VSLEAAKWEHSLHQRGWSVTRAAGAFFDHRDTDVLAAGLWSDKPGEDPPPVDHDTIAHLVHSHDLLVLDNAGSLWTAPEASMAWEQHALAAGIPTIIRHHDPPWQGVPLRSVPADTIPLHHPRHLHILINQLTYNEFAHRWPGLEESGALRLVHNLIDVDHFLRGDREGTRHHLGVQSDEVLIAHPARAIAARKNVPGAVEFSLALQEKLGRPVRYWITDGSVITDETLRKFAHVRANQAALDRAPGLIRGQVPHQADLYAASDLILLPSTWEGWGLPVIEAAAAKKITVAGPYPVLDEIRQFGLTVFDPSAIAEVAELITDPTTAATLLDNNQAIARKHFNLQTLPATLTAFVSKAKELAATPTSE
jgi:glycosyltransferase involved in cell wall biosynthesis